MESSSDAALVAPCVAFVTLGCAKNEADTARMRVRLAEAGFLIEDDPAEADAVVVNTCSFIQSATEESIEAVFDAAGMPNVAAGAPLIVAGCMPARYGEELADELVEARAFVPCSREDDIAAIVADALGVDAPGGGAAASVTLSASGGAAEVEGSRAALAALPAAPFAYVKISDGCDRFCTYCTIPYIRGRYRSFLLDDVRADVAAQVAAGAREIVLIAQDTGRWGADFDEPSSLAALVAALAEEFPQTWFRIMYIQPEGLSDELLDAVAAHDNVCDYFDIPLQHVDAGILRAMNRTGSREEFLALVGRVLAHVPGATLRTTLIAGFPGETEEQFEDLCSFVEEGLFDYVGVFPYSREEGTRAFDLPGQLDEDEKNDRAQRLRDLADAVCCPRIAARVGREMDVLVEGVEEDGQLFGRAMCQAPEVDGVTYLDAGEPGEIRRVRIVDALLYEMEGE
ncbi:30S ribosomal protein S12 methylthiotransferase RimO [Eggerthella lenta]|uniref:30S ribosomal protein S12 methylthiotransferase RimO n=1 Tax=Eggerthella lenta TaxID=84112 RepID=UPI000A39E3E0|nr:30S ribosomal protein S12 methylthiotransferase RimO [Eggerthella lenta]MDB1741593.1 30S ribosomal protein S12 methylthiotransferase RimO [Eggerthella lenta]MDB1744516.1 30S ribosomal protein S12 methylthiotransferase RimO [Eggerthella lenta]